MCSIVYENTTNQIEKGKESTKSEILILLTTHFSSHDFFIFLVLSYPCWIFSFLLFNNSFPLLYIPHNNSFLSLKVISNSFFLYISLVLRYLSQSFQYFFGIFITQMLWLLRSPQWKSLLFLLNVSFSSNSDLSH